MQDYLEYKTKSRSLIPPKPNPKTPNLRVEELIRVLE